MGCSGSEDDSPTTQLSYQVDNGQIENNGEVIHLFGVNWFGFETSDYVVHGLWEVDYQDTIQQMKDLGFNAVRLPFCPTTLQGVEASSITYWEINENLEGLDSLELLDIIMEELNSQQMYILLDHHRPDCNAISELWYTDSYSEDEWIEDLVFVAERYQDLEYFIGIDLKNEPHTSATWGTGNEETDWNTAAENASTAILEANENILIFVEGIQENDSCSDSTWGHWWGGNLEPQACSPLDIDSTKLVLSPHVYGPDVYAQSYFDEEVFPQNMPEIWETHFGFLVETGYAVIPGEFGGQYGEGDEQDDEWQDTLIDYFIDKEMCNFFYWCWNPDSGDTGGILDDDWVSVKENKYNNLKRLMDFCAP